MSTTAVGRCEHCSAVVNRRWPNCLVCHAPLIAAPTRETGIPPSALASTQAQEAPPLAPGDQITWQIGAGGKVKKGVVDFLHTYPGEAWAFCTLPDGRWTAVNVKHILKREHGVDGEGQVTQGGQR